jgi:hypothetical protein
MSCGYEQNIIEYIAPFVEEQENIPSIPSSENKNLNESIFLRQKSIKTENNIKSKEKIV